MFPSIRSPDSSRLFDEGMRSIHVLSVTCPPNDFGTIWCLVFMDVLPLARGFDVDQNFDRPSLRFVEVETPFRMKRFETFELAIIRNVLCDLVVVVKDGMVFAVNSIA
jgi:hypothetical protein